MAFLRMVPVIALSLLLANPPHASSQPAVPSATDSVASQLDSTTATVSCTDLRTGIEFRYHARRVTAAGALDTAAAGQDVLCLGSSDVLALRSARLDDGGVIVAWVDERRGDSDIYAKRLLATEELAPGWPAEGQPVCTAPQSQYGVEVAPDGVGGAYIAWQDYRGGSEGRLYVQRLAPDGVPASGWPSSGLALCPALGEQSTPCLVPDGTGGAFVLWLDRRGGGLDIYGQHLSPAGPSVLWSEDGLALVSGPALRTALRAVPDGSGGFLVAWREDTEAAVGLRALRIGPEGAVASGWSPEGLSLLPATRLVSEPAVLADSAGNMVVAWAEAGTERSGLYATLLTPQGELVTGWPPGGRVVAAGAVGLNSPVLRRAASGDVVLAWEDRRGGAGSDIRAQRLTIAGEPVPGWPAEGLAVCTAAGEQYLPSVALDASGAALVTWLDDRLDVQAGFLRAARLGGDLPQLVEVKALPTVVRLIWEMPSGRDWAFKVHRRAPGREWLSLETPPGKEGRLVLEDRTVQPGDTLEYRLAVRTAGVEAFLEPVSVKVPLAPTTLALSRPRLSAARRAILATLALPTAAPAKLELLDVAGRRVISHQVGALGIGEHDVQLPLPAGLARGIYFLRLTQGRQARVAKVIYLR